MSTWDAVECALMLASGEAEGARADWAGPSRHIRVRRLTRGVGAPPKLTDSLGEMVRDKTFSITLADPPASHS